jgi:hypothetical protein
LIPLHICHKATIGNRIESLRVLDIWYNGGYRELTFRDYDDGGSKQTVDDMVSELEEEQRAKTKVFHREISSGAPDTIFNESIDRTDSEYFVIHDDDDTWHSEFLEYTVAHLDNHTD